MDGSEQHHHVGLLQLIVVGFVIQIIIKKEAIYVVMIENIVMVEVVQVMMVQLNVFRHEV